MSARLRAGNRVATLARPALPVAMNATQHGHDEELA